MAQYRKKPVVVEALLVRRVLDLIKKDEEAALPEWFLSAYRGGKLHVWGETIKIPTLEGEMTASNDDYLVRGVAGELYPCKPDIFALTFEELEGHAHGPAVRSPASA